MLYNVIGCTARSQLEILNVISKCRHLVSLRLAIDGIDSRDWSHCMPRLGLLERFGVCCGSSYFSCKMFNLLKAHCQMITSIEIMVFKYNADTYNRAFLKRIFEMMPKEVSIHFTPGNGDLSFPISQELLIPFIN